MSVLTCFAFVLERDRKHSEELRLQFEKAQVECDARLTQIQAQIDELERYEICSCTLCCLTAFRPIREALGPVDTTFAGLKNLQRADLYAYRAQQTLPKLVAAMLEIVCCTLFIVSSVLSFSDCGVVIRQVPFSGDSLRTILSDTRIAKWIQAADSSFN